MWILTFIGLYLLAQCVRRQGVTSGGRILPVILESLALVLLVIWRTLSTVSRTRW